MMRKIGYIISGVLLVSILVFAEYRVVSSKDKYTKISESLNLFNEVYKRISTTYVDDIEPESFIEAGINGMLGTLYSFTTYISEERRSALDRPTIGKYG